MQILKADTSVVIMLGPAVDKTDGVTLESGLVTAMDTATTGVRISKNGGAWTDRNGTVTTTVYDEGWYRVTLDATDTNTEGTLDVMYEDAATCLPMFARFQVVNANVYDSLFAAATTDYLQVDMLQLGGATQSATDLKDFADAGYDPATNKVQGVVLVDTTTTNTDMRGTDSAFLAASAPTNFSSLSITAGGTVNADMVAISTDTTAADNLELMFDGTGYTDSTAPASRAQVDGIGAASGGSLNFEASADNASSPIKTVSSVGTQTGTFANTQAADGSYHVITHATNDIDWIYDFSVGGARTAVEVTFRGYLTGANDSMLIQAYDFVGTDWETLAVLNGQAGTDNVTITASLLSKHTGTGTDLGSVLIRFEANGAMTSPILSVDQLLVAAVNIGQSVGYSNGTIWIDTGASNTNTETFVDGTADNPVSTIAAANTLNSTLGLDHFYVSPGSSITLAASQTNQLFEGEGWSLALGGQDISSSHFYEAIVTGTGTTASGNPDFHHCEIGTATIGPADFHDTGFSGTLTATAGDYFLTHCYSQVAGSGAPAFAFGSVAGATNINVRGWHGGSTWTLNSSCTMSLEVDKGGTQTVTTGGANVEIRAFCKSITITHAAGGTVNIIAMTGPITINGTGGTVNVYGQHSGITDNSSGSVTINDSSVDGSAVGTNIAALLNDLPNKPTKNVAFSNFSFLMVDATDFATPETGLTVSGEISQDGAAFGALTNSVTEIANGMYKVNLTQAEMNADVISLRFTATGAADRLVTIYTQPT